MSRLMTKPTKWPVRPAKTQISLGIRLVWSETSQCAQWVAEDPVFMRTAKTLIRLGGCPGWSESSLVANLILLVLSWCCSNVFHTRSPIPFHWQDAMQKNPEKGSVYYELLEERNIGELPNHTVNFSRDLWQCYSVTPSVTFSKAIWAAHDTTNSIACAPSEDSDQPGPPPSQSNYYPHEDALGPSYPLSAQRRL